MYEEKRINAEIESQCIHQQIQNDHNTSLDSEIEYDEAPSNIETTEQSTFITESERNHSEP